MIEDIEKEKPETYDVAVLSNILHEVTPPIFAEILTAVRRLLTPNGRLVVLELSPLIHPEKYAVPLSKEQMESILHGCGWKVDSGFFPVRSGSIQAYWVCGHTPDESISFDRSHVQQTIENKWEEILTHNCLLYDGKYQITTADDQIRVMDNLTTIASIMNYRLGHWT